MKVVSVINYKGGVGKTTVTANLAADMARRGKCVLVVDLDPQTNLTFCFMKPDEWEEKYADNRTIKFWFDSILGDSDATPHFEDLAVDKHGIDILCSHLGLIDVDLDLAASLSGGTLKQQKRNYIKTYSYIRKELVHLSEGYDVVLFDCPPNFSTVTKNALIASDYYVVPAKMDYLSTLGINFLENHIRNLVKEYNQYSNELGYREEHRVNPKFLGVIATMVQYSANGPITSIKAQQAELQRSGFTMFQSMVRENKNFYSSALETSTPVVLHAPSNVTYTNIVQEMKALTTEFMRRVGL